MLQKIIYFLSVSVPVCVRKGIKILYYTRKEAIEDLDKDFVMEKIKETYEIDYISLLISIHWMYKCL